MNKIVRDKGRAVCSALNISFKQMHFFSPRDWFIKRGGEKKGLKKITRKPWGATSPSSLCESCGYWRRGIADEWEELLLSVFPWAVQGAPVGHSLESSRWSRAGAAWHHSLCTLQGVRLRDSPVLSTIPSAPKFNYCKTSTAGFKKTSFAGC